jgi:hypothetical protein
MIFRVLAIFLCCVPVYAQQAKPVVSAEPISAERMEIYRDFLSGYNNGSGSILNVANATTTFFISNDDDFKGCLKGFDPDAFKVTTFHQFAPDAFPTSATRLVDPKKVKRRDPGDAIKHGESVEDAVRTGFAAGIFSFSEIAFDGPHTHAAFTYSFVCGSLCGSGGTVVYELHDGNWKQDKRQHCGQWIS